MLATNEKGTERSSNKFTAERVTLTGREAANGTEQKLHRRQCYCRCGDRNAGDGAECSSIEYTAETARTERGTKE